MTTSPELPNKLSYVLTALATAIAHQSWKGIGPILTNLMLVVAFEVAVMTLVKCNQNRHDFTQPKSASKLLLMGVTSLIVFYLFSA
jgi:hypothetical protein